jgi:iron complex transport system ATP-binding protein
MYNDIIKVIELDCLKIGYPSGNRSDPILPPLSAISSGGELIAVIGRNGIGKSTMLRTIAGLQPSLGGEVLISGKTISGYSRMELARKIGYISTEVIKVNNMSVFDLVALGRFPHTNWLGNLVQEDRLAIETSITRTGLSALRNRNILEISDGERQKAMIARVLAQDTDLMIMDEPTAFLDIASKYEIIRLMLELTRDGKTIIFSTHDFNIAVNQADKIWLMSDNRLIEGAPEDLVLRGEFEHLFDSSIVQFSKTDGGFSFQHESRGSVSVKGEGIMLKWTERALLRAGYTLSDSLSELTVRVPSKTGEEWLLISDSSSTAFRTIYDLIRKISD